MHSNLWMIFSTCIFPTWTEWFLMGRALVSLGCSSQSQICPFENSLGCTWLANRKCCFILKTKQGFIFSFPLRERMFAVLSQTPCFSLSLTTQRLQFPHWFRSKEEKKGESKRPTPRKQHPAAAVWDLYFSIFFFSPLLFFSGRSFNVRSSILGETVTHTPLRSSKKTACACALKCYFPFSLHAKKDEDGLAMAHEYYALHSGCFQLPCIRAPKRALHSIDRRTNLGKRARTANARASAHIWIPAKKESPLRVLNWGGNPL